MKNPFKNFRIPKINYTIGSMITAAVAVAVVVLSVVLLFVMGACDYDVRLRAGGDADLITATPRQQVTSALKVSYRLVTPLPARGDA